MKPLVGESDVEQLRERVQGLEAGPSAATFDDAGEPVLEFDESGPSPVRRGWEQHGGDPDRFVGVSTDDTRPHVLRLTAAEAADPPANRHHKLIGDAEVDADEATTGESIEVEIINADGNEQAKIVHLVPAATEYYTYLTTACGYWIAVNATGHVLGAAYFESGTGWHWEGIGGVAHPAAFPEPTWSPAEWL